MEQQTIINRKRQSYKLEQQTQMEQRTLMYVHVLDYCSNPRVMYDVSMFLNKVILSSSLENTYFI